MRQYRISQGETPKSADWKRVLDLGSTLLREESKDLVVAARVTEALGRLHGFAGLRDGLRLFRGIHVRFWKTYFPEFNPSTLAARKKPFDRLERLLPPVIRDQPL